MSETTVNEAAAAAPAPKPKRPKAKSMIMMGEQTAAMFENARLAKEKGEPGGLVCVNLPPGDRRDTGIKCSLSGKPCGGNCGQTSG